MSDAPVQTQAGLETQPPLPVRRLHNFIYCPRLFYFQWVENIFQENADTVAGSHAHRNVDAPSKLEDARELGLPEGAKDARSAGAATLAFRAWRGGGVSRLHDALTREQPMADRQ